MASRELGSDARMASREMGSEYVAALMSMWQYVAVCSSKDEYAAANWKDRGLVDTAATVHETTHRV